MYHSIPKAVDSILAEVYVNRDSLSEKGRTDWPFNGKNNPKLHTLAKTVL
jgi:hypothetical protein